MTQKELMNWLLKKLKISQSQMGRELKMTREYLNRVVNEHQDISVSLADHIDDRYHCGFMEKAKKNKLIKNRNNC